MPLMAYGAKPEKELDAIYKAKTVLELIREQNALGEANSSGLWEKVK